MRVLVAFASKRGSTAGIAEAIRDRLREDGVEADALPVQQVRGLGPYDAVVVGSAVYANRWRRGAVRFLRRRRTALAEGPVWLFQSGPLDDSADREEIALPKNVASLAERIGARGHATFGGALAEDTTGFIARKMVEGGHGGDFRNFDRIRAFADGIENELGARAD